MGMKLEVPSESEAVKACREILEDPDGSWAHALGDPEVEGLRAGLAALCTSIGLCVSPDMLARYAFRAGVERALDWAHSIAMGGLPIPDEVFEGKKDQTFPTQRISSGTLKDLPGGCLESNETQ